MVPALLTMLGERTWWIPAWLDRVLPNLTIEPPSTGGALDAPAGSRDVPQPEPEPVA